MRMRADSSTAMCIIISYQRQQLWKFIRSFQRRNTTACKRSLLRIFPQDKGPCEKLLTYKRKISNMDSGYTVCVIMFTSTKNVTLMCYVSDTWSVSCFLSPTNSRTWPSKVIVCVHALCYDEQYWLHLHIHYHMTTHTLSQQPTSPVLQLRGCSFAILLRGAAREFTPPLKALWVYIDVHTLGLLLYTCIRACMYAYMYQYACVCAGEYRNWWFSHASLCRCTYICRCK